MFLSIYEEYIRLLDERIKQHAETLMSGKINNMEQYKYLSAQYFEAKYAKILFESLMKKDNDTNHLSDFDK